MPQIDVYEMVTEKILDALENGTVPWHRPWNAATSGPVSIGSNKAYRGVNAFLLDPSLNGYTSPYWGTYKAIGDVGGQVRKGEHGSLAVFWTMFTPKSEAIAAKSENRAPALIPLLRYHKVFNAEQANDLPARYVTPTPPVESAEQIMMGYLAGAKAPGLRYGGNRAYYSPANDYVQLPDRGSFNGVEEFYSTAFHELTHSTGHADRLARKDLLNAHYFGDPSYSREELVAEMGAAMLSGVAGIHQTTVPNSAAYLKSWMDALHGDKKLVVSAAGQAQRAADMIRGITWNESE